MLRFGKHLQGPGKVKRVEARVEGEEDFDLLRRTTDLSILWNDCTHLAGIVFELYVL